MMKPSVDGAMATTVRAGLSNAVSRSLSGRQCLVYMIVMVAILVTLVHLPSLSARALFMDDDQYVAMNPLVQHPSVESLCRVFREISKPSTVMGYYQPLTMVSLMLDRFLCGPYESMQSYHRTSLFLHVANTVLLGVLLYMLFSDFVAAAGIALLFGLHPIAVESVCWLSERKTVLATFFALWALIAYVKFSQEMKIRFYVMCTGMYILALLSKPITVPLPLMMLLMDYWPLNRLERSSVKEKWPLFSVAIAFAVITYVSQSLAGSTDLPSLNSVFVTILMLLRNLLFYLGKIFCPIALSAHYEASRLGGWLQPELLVGTIGSICLVGCLIVSLRWTRAFLTGWLIFVVMILPTLGIVKVTEVDVANRYIYLPSIGVILTLAWALSRSASIAASRVGQRSRILICGGILVLAGTEGKLTRQYSLCWRDSRSLYEHMLCMYPTSSVLHNNFATDLRAMGQVEEAITHFRAAIDTDPNSFRAHYNLALVLQDQNGVSDEVVQHYRAAIKIKPSFVPGYVNLGGVLIRQGNLSEAESVLNKATEIDPRFGLARYNLGNALIFRGKPVEGVAALHEALRINPDSLMAIKTLAWILATHPSTEIRDVNEAIRLAERAEGMTQGRDVRVLDALAAAYALDGRYKKAIETADKAFSIAKRVRDYELMDQIQERLRLYQFECPYYEDPKVQLERMVAKTKTPEDGRPKTEDSELTTDGRELETENSLEMSDETDASVAQ